ncbi:MAG: hypothetical protein GC154_12400 [bacterium]|nr:hypothetical protein [bacterium]
MRKVTLICLALLIVFGAAFYWLQTKIMESRAHRRVEEKILMLSDRPEVTKILSLGFENTVADLLWIRAIQYFGGNFSTLDQDIKKEGMTKLFDNIVGLDPRFIAAWQFGGFIMNESMKDPEQAISFLLEGGRKNPEAWKLTFDAGFISFYQLKDYEAAKELFIQSAYGPNLAKTAELSATGLEAGSDLTAVEDTDPISEATFEPGGQLTAAFDSVHEFGRLGLKIGANAIHDYDIQKSETGAEPFDLVASVTGVGMNVTMFDTPMKAKAIRFANLKTETEGEPFILSDLEIRGPRNPNTPSYVERMAFEMDRASGRFSAAWNQFIRYYQDARKKGDTVSMDIAAKKLFDIYNNKVDEVLQEAVKQYQQDHNGDLPSMKMHELVEQGYLERIVKQKMNEDPNFASEVMPVLMPSGNLYELLTTWDNSEPQLLVKPEVEGMEWLIISRTEMVQRLQEQLKMLNQMLDKYKEENGKPPASIDDFKSQSWFKGQERLLEDPLEGEIFYNSESGKIEERNPKI